MTLHTCCLNTVSHMFIYIQLTHRMQTYMYNMVFDLKQIILWSRNRHRTILYSVLPRIRHMQFVGDPTEHDATYHIPYNSVVLRRSDSRVLQDYHSSLICIGLVLHTSVHCDAECIPTRCNRGFSF